MKRKRFRNSTFKNYYTIWKIFNKFLVRLDYLPLSWENRTVLFCAHMIQKGIKSSTLRNYVSAIKATLVDVGHKWSDDTILLNTLTRACKMENDVLTVRLPIHGKLLEFILFEVEREYYLKMNQPYLSILYKAIFSLAYYSLFRVGELTTGLVEDHTLKA